jgi:hypothetical protein
MSSPGARQRRRRQQYQSPRTRNEIATAVLAAALIVGGTVLLIWMLRPGGIADRQPKATGLIGVTLGAVLLAAYVILRPSSRLEVDRRIALAGSISVLVAAAVIAGVVWPRGLLRHTPTTPTFPTTPTSPTTTAPAGATTTTAPPGTTTSTIP